MGTFLLLNLCVGVIVAVFSQITSHNEDEEDEALRRQHQIKHFAEAWSSLHFQLSTVNKKDGIDSSTAAALMATSGTSSFVGERAVGRKNVCVVTLELPFREFALDRGRLLEDFRADVADLLGLSR